jgi:hypothetical protein
MPPVGFDTWFPKDCPTVFVVRNVAPFNKTIKIFNYPIPNGKERDLMCINYVSEADIRHALLKGELMIKLRTQEAIVTASNIDLLQFDDCQKAFLKSVGILEGLEIASVPATIPFAFKQDVPLAGALDNSNRIFKTPDKFIDGEFANNDFHILVKHNGRSLVEGIDFFIAESGGPGTGFDTIILNFTPKPRSILVADYVIQISI